MARAYLFQFSSRESFSQILSFSKILWICGQDMNSPTHDLLLCFSHSWMPCPFAMFYKLFIIKLLISRKIEYRVPFYLLPCFNTHEYFEMLDRCFAEILKINHKYCDISYFKRVHYASLKLRAFSYFIIIVILMFSLHL